MLIFTNYILFRVVTNLMKGLQSHLHGEQCFNSDRSVIDFANFSFMLSILLSLSHVAAAQFVALSFVLIFHLKLRNFSFVPLPFLLCHLLIVAPF